jgi:hypothetical protein
MFLDKIALFVVVGLLLFMAASFVVKHFIRNKSKV